jgi:signal transduction histidine kinase
MENAEQSKEPLIPELAGLRQCIADLELPPAVRQTLEKALTQSEERLRQRLYQTVQHAERFVLLGQMAARMAHEVRNPLNAISLHTDVLEEEMRQPSSDSRLQAEESLTEIRTEVMRLYNVVQDYLALARLAVLDREPEDLAALLKECALEVQEQVESRGITLHLEGLARLGRVSLHKGTMRRAIFNLMQQALDAMPQGGTLTLRGRRMASQVAIEVWHTGIGIPEEQLGLIFEPFYTTGLEWTGLGLYVVREIVAAHGGTIDVQSEPGKGSRFIITLSLVATDATC